MLEYDQTFPNNGHRSPLVKAAPFFEIRHLRYFIAAAEHGSFRKAALTLGIRQSAISRRIRDLEDRIGASLFHRHSGGVRLTIAGQRFLPKARNTLRHASEGAADVAAIGRAEEGCLRIGILSSLASGFLAKLLRDYSRSRAICIELIDGDPAEHVAAIRQFQLDVAFVTGTREWTDCDTARLWSERIFAVLPDAHHLAERETLDWSDLSNETFIVSETAYGREVHDYLVQRLASPGRQPEIQVQYVGRDNLVPLVALGRGLTVTSEATTAAQFPGICYRPIADEVLPFSAVWSPRNDNPAFRRLLSMAKAQARKS